MSFLKTLGEPSCHGVVPILASQLMVALRAQDTKLSGSNVDEGDIKGAATQVIDQHELVLLSKFQSKGQCGSRRFVDDLQYLKPSLLASRDRGSALMVVEIRRNCDHDLLHGPFQKSFGIPRE